MMNAMPERSAIKSAGAIRMALAKSFLFNANRANRVCLKNKASLAIDRDERERFLSATKPLVDVRDVNEHGYDGDRRSEKHRPTRGLVGGRCMHLHLYRDESRSGHFDLDHPWTIDLVTVTAAAILVVGFASALVAHLVR
jgi:hypothetical protein